MRSLPIVERELRIRARVVSTVWSRVGAAAVAGLMVAWVLLSSPGIRSRGGMGPGVFQALSWLAMVFVLLEGVRLTHDAVSGERQEGTLGLLFLTPLRGIDVVMGKLAASGLTAVYGVLAIVPALAITLLVGGVALGEVMRVGLALLNALFGSMTLGLWVSSRVSDSGRALLASLGWLLAWVGLPWLLEAVVQRGGLSLGLSSLGSLSPGAGLLFSQAVFYQASGGQSKYWACIVLVQLMSWWFLVMAGRRTATYRQLREGARELDGHGRARRLVNRRFVGWEAPGRWMASRDGRMRLRAWFAGLCLVVPSVVPMVFGAWNTSSGGSVGLFVNLGLHLVAAVILASLVCRPLIEARQSGMLELLLTTPLKAESFVRSYWRGIRDVAFAPVLILQGVEALMQIAQYALNAHPYGHFQFEIAVQVLLGFGYAVVYLLALTWTGMWWSTSLRKPGWAVFRTVLWVSVLPYVAAYVGLPLYRLVIGLGVPFFLYVRLFTLGPMVVLVIMWRIYHHRMRTRFRRAITRDPFAPGDSTLPGEGFRVRIQRMRRWQAD